MPISEEYKKLIECNLDEIHKWITPLRHLVTLEQNIKSPDYSTFRQTKLNNITSMLGIQQDETEQLLRLSYLTETEKRGLSNITTSYEFLDGIHDLCVEKDNFSFFSDQETSIRNLLTKLNTNANTIFENINTRITDAANIMPGLLGLAKEETVAYGKDYVDVMSKFLDFADEFVAEEEIDYESDDTFNMSASAEPKPFDKDRRPPPSGVSSGKRGNPNELIGPSKKDINDENQKTRAATLKRLNDFQRKARFEKLQQSCRKDAHSPIESKGCPRLII